MIGVVRLRYVYLLEPAQVWRQKLRVEERRAAQLYFGVSSQAALSDATSEWLREVATPEQVILVEAALLLSQLSGH